MKQINKRGQNEIVGFVAIVLVVAVAGLILFSLMIGKGNVQEDSAEISDFISASMYKTTDCAISFVPQYKNIEELIKECYKNPSGKCLDERKICDVLNLEFKNIIERDLEIGNEKINKGYKMNLVYKDSEISQEEIISSVEGGNFENCRVKIGSSNPIAVGSFSSGIIDVELEVCRG